MATTSTKKAASTKSTSSRSSSRSSTAKPAESSVPKPEGSVFNVVLLKDRYIDGSFKAGRNITVTTNEAQRSSEMRYVSSDKLDRLIVCKCIEATSRNTGEPKIISDATSTASIEAAAKAREARAKAEQKRIEELAEKRAQEIIAAKEAASKEN